ncbi:hypothetical protein ASD24_11805 [Paenibacillus sp. Root52]|nr:hypothetical protein ASD24_11805 [Paenibacillus sp. Root52]
MPTRQRRKAPALREAEQGARARSAAMPEMVPVSLARITAIFSGDPGRQALRHQPLHSKTRPTAASANGSPEGRALWGPPSEGRVWVGAIPPI